MSQLFQFPEICITEASAGSGKTYALAKRYVQLLLTTSRQNPQSYKNILAITFTNKASLEMKKRVIGFLKKIALKDLSKEEIHDFLDPLNMSHEEAAALAYGIMESIIHHYHFFAVKTIDSFVNALLSGCAFKINLSARFKIQRNSGDYLQQSLDQWISLSDQDKNVRQLLDDFVHQYLFLENRSGWFPKEDLLEVLKTLFSEYNIYQKSFLIFPVENKDLYLAKKKFLEHAQGILSLADDSMNKGFLKSLSNFVQEHPVSFDLDQMSKYFARTEVPLNKGASPNGELGNLWSKAYKEAQNLCLAESYGVFNPYVTIFQNVTSILSRICAQEDILFLEELNKKAAALMDDGMSVTELYYRLAVRFHHYLIDEFQDTSMAQWKNILPMVEEALSTGGSLFFVGDKKQAIYSFRGGESRLFDEVAQQLSNAPVRYEYLTKNWRSHKAIVEFNNQLFSPDNISDFLNLREDYYLEKKSNDEVFFSENEIIALQDTFAHSYQEIREDLDQGYVEIKRVEGRRKQDREGIIKDYLFQTIADARYRFALKDIAVLTRTNSQVQKVTQWLLSQGIYAQSDRTSDIKNHSLIIELVDFLRFLNSPIDNVSFARFVLGDILPKASGISQETLREFLFQCRRRKEMSVEFYLYKEFRNKFPEVWNAYIEDFFSQVGIYPVYELVVSIYSRFRLSEFEESQGFLMHFLELIKRREEFSCDVETFIHYFDALENEERFVPIPSADAVRVTTLHKAKGLEFGVVIIPFLEMIVQKSKGSQGGLSYVLDVEEEGMRMLRLKKTYGYFSEHLKKRYEQEYKASFKVELNNVYVALTRPVHELYVVIPERSGSSINPVQFLIPEHLTTIGQKQAALKPQKEEKPLPLLKVTFDRQWVPQLKEEFSEVDREQAQLRLQGVIMHFCLAQISKIEGNGLELIALAISKAKANFGLLMNEDIYTEQLKNFLSREDVKPFFEFGETPQVFCEQEIVNCYGDAKRMDRLVVFKDKVWIVDFKASHTDEAEHQKQIKEYEQLVGQLYPKHKVEGFLVYLT